MTFYPVHLPPPEQLRTEHFVVRPLRASDNQLDYEALMASQDLLLASSAGMWPRPGFTREENLADLEEHEEEYQARTSFTLTVMCPDEQRCLGCVYINPAEPRFAKLTERPPALTALPPNAAVVDFWLRPPHMEDDLGASFLAALHSWLTSEWRFARVLYPITHREPFHQRLIEQVGLQLIATAQTELSTVFVYE